MIERFRIRKWQSLESWAGQLLDAMLASKSQTQMHLRDPNWAIRLTALLLLDDRWQAVPGMAEAYADMVISDSVAVIRGVALWLLTDCVRSGSLPGLPDRIRHLSKLILGPVLAKEETGEARSSVLGMLKDIAIMKAVDRKRRSEEVRQMAGPLSDDLLHNRSLTVSSLQHPDPGIRRAALNLFKGHWKPPSDFDQICIRKVNEDADTLVRCDALSALVETRVEKEVPELGPLLSTLVADKSQPLDLRELAYFWMLQIRGIGILEWRSLPRDDAGFEAAID